MKATELKEKSDDELVELAATLARDLWKAKFSNHSNQLDDTDKIRRLRRDIARIRTLQTQRRAAAAGGNG